MKLIKIIGILYLLFCPEVWAQLNTSSSTNQSQSSQNTGIMYGPTHTRQQCNGNNLPEPPPCFEDQKIWQEGRWGFSYGRRIWIPGHWTIRKVAIPCPPPVYQPPPNYNPNAMGCVQPTLSPAQFNQALLTLNSRSFENTKLVMARDMVVNNCLTTDQVRQLMSCFNFEINRLEIAKNCFANTCDKQNYYLVNNLFSFDSSVMELSRFINDFGR